MPGSSTTPGRSGACDGAPARVAFRPVDDVGARENTLPRLDGWPMRSPVNASPLTSRPDAHDSGASVGRYSFTVTDLHRLLLAGLPAHQL